MFLSGRFNSPIDLIWRLRFDAIWLTYSELSCFGGESVSDLAGYIGDTIFHPKIYGKTTEKQKPPRPKIRFRRPVSGRPKGMFRMFFFQNPSQSEELEEWSKKSSSWVFLEIIIWRYIFQQKNNWKKMERFIRFYEVDSYCKKSPDFWTLPRFCSIHGCACSNRSSSLPGMGNRWRPCNEKVVGPRCCRCWVPW